MVNGSHTHLDWSDRRQHFVNDNQGKVHDVNLGKYCYLLDAPGQKKRKNKFWVRCIDMRFKMPWHHCHQFIPNGGMRWQWTYPWCWILLILSGLSTKIYVNIEMSADVTLNWFLKKPEHPEEFETLVVKQLGKLSNIYDLYYFTITRWFYMPTRFYCFQELDIYIYIYMCVCVYTRVCVCVCVRMICIFAHVFICMHACVYIHRSLVGLWYICLYISMNMRTLMCLILICACITL